MYGKNLYLEGKLFIRKAWNNLPDNIKKNYALRFQAAKDKSVGVSVDITGKRISVSGGYCKLMAQCRIIEIIAHQEDSRFLENMFRQTCGHEISHAGDRYYYRTGSLILTTVLKKYSFFSKVNEVHADFNGAYLFSLTADDAAKSMEMKRCIMGDVVKATHPSWSQRIKYISTGRYDAALVRMIADDMHYTNQTAIAEAEGFYQDIVLRAHSERQ